MLKFAGLNIKSFGRGGVHPKGNKHIAKDHAIDNFHIPQKVYISLSQHLGKPAKPVVNKGDIVTEGQLVGEMDGMFSANIHTGVPGKVVDVGNYLTINNFKVPTVVIQFEGELTKDNDKKEDWLKLLKENIIEKVTNAGIVGMGGAAFPAHIKLNVPPEKKINFLIINGTECEPYLTCDYRLMMEKSDELLEGIKILQKVLDVKKAYIGIELNKKDTIKKYKELTLNNKDGIEVVPLRVRYPQGGEKQLIKAVIKKEVPSGGLPFDVGALVSNVGTILAIREAVLFDKPLTERVVSVTGTIVKKPGNYKMKIGTPVSDIIEEVGLTEGPSKIIFGGPMMGMAVSSTDVGITKGTSGILFLSTKEDKVKYNEFRDCVHCSKCVLACPSGLNPAILSILSENEKTDMLKENNILDCIECGCCNYVCPANRPIVQFVKLGKLALRKGV